MENKNFFKNHSFILAVLTIILLTLGFYIVTGDMWIFLFGVSVIIIISCLFIYERRKYEHTLEKMAEYVDHILSGQTLDTDEKMSDSLDSKLSHRLSKLQRMVKAYYEKAEKDKQEIRDLIVEIAHQLRMPIANIDTYLQLLDAEDTDEDERRKYLNAIYLSKNKLIFLIESFIKMSRLESNIIQIKKTSNDLNRTIYEELYNMENKAEDKGIRLLFDEDEQFSVPHDKNWLGEAIFNLLDNSVKYSPSDSEIKISIKKNSMFTEIRIEDKGEPLPIHEESLIFKRFYRGSNVKDQDGFGLGLYLSREIILKHNGFIKFRNLKSGHSFSIFLPV